MNTITATGRMPSLCRLNVRVVVRSACRWHGLVGDWRDSDNRPHAMCQPGRLESAGIGWKVWPTHG